MQVNAIVSANAGNGLKSAQNFKGRRENIDAFINLDDGTIRQAAYLKTQNSIDTAKHEKLNDALIYAFPLAGGLSAAAYAVKGMRMSAFAGGAVGWGLFLAGMSAVFGLEKYAKKHSENIRDFSNNHPLLSYAGSVVAGFAAGDMAIAGGSKLLNKIAGTEIYKKAAKFIEKGINKFASLKFVDKAGKVAGDTIAKTPSALKQSAKVLASWSPLILGFGALFHVLNHRSVVNKEFVHNYSDLKEKQLNLARRRSAELALENDFMKTNPQNIEDLELLRNSKKI